MPSRLNFSRWILFGNLLLIAALHVEASSSYKLTPVARIGDAGLTQIEPSVSINRQGRVVFLGEAENKAGIFVRPAPNGADQLVNITKPFGWDGLWFGSSVQINDSNTVVADDTWRIPFSNSLLSILRIWELNGSPNNISENEIGALGAVVAFGSINNRGDVAFLRGEKPTSFSAFSWSLAMAGEGGMNKVSVPPVRRAGDGELLMRPMMADDTSVLIHVGPDDRPAIRLYRNNLRTPILIASSEQGAAPEMGFAELGSLPGISDDGDVVVFSGNRGNGPGIFISVEDSPGSRKLINVVAENEAKSGPKPELGVDAAGKPLFFKSFDFESRVGVIHEPSGAPGIEEDVFVVCFVGTPNAAGSSFAAATGIWTIRGTITRAKNEPSQIELAGLTVSPVIQAGDPVPGIGALTSFTLFDPLTKLDPAIESSPAPLAIHAVAFSASVGTQRAVIKAISVPGSGAAIAITVHDPSTGQLIPPSIQPSILRLNHEINAWSQIRRALLLKIDAPANTPLRAYVSAADRSGGHEHGAVARPHGWLTLKRPSQKARGDLPPFWNKPLPAGYNEGGTTAYGNYERAFRFASDAQGKAALYYIASEISGRETITVETENVSVSSHSKNAVVITNAVLGLVALPSSADINPVGQTGRHPRNHYGTPGLIKAIQALARNYASETPRDSLPTPTLAVNDLSLEQGGLFDIHSGVDGKYYGPEWETPHKGHRLGIEVDLDLRPNNPTFDRIWQEQGFFTRIPEGTHYHLVLTGQGRVSIGSPPSPPPLVKTWDVRTRTVSFVLPNQNRGGLAANSVIVGEANCSRGVTLLNFSAPVSLGAIGIRETAGLTLSAIVPANVPRFVVRWRGTATSADLPGQVFKFPNNGKFLTRWVHLPVNAQLGTQSLLSTRGVGNWSLHLTDSVQVPAAGKTLIYHATIENKTGADVFLDGMDFVFNTPVPDANYELDWAPEFLDTDGVVPANGYRGPLFFLKWLQNPPIGSVNAGEVILTSDTKTVSASFTSPFELQQIQIRTSGTNVVISWNSSATNAVLESTDSLTGNAVESPVWTAVEGPVITSGATNEIRLAPAETITFYRLSFP